jgi:hypothetical protein
MQQQIIKETFQLVSKRDDNVCNFLEGGRLVTVLHSYFNIDIHKSNFCDGARWNAVLEVLSQKDRSRKDVPECHFPGIGISNTTPLRPNFGSLFAFRNLFQNKNSVGYMKCVLIIVLIFQFDWWFRL